MSKQRKVDFQALIAGEASAVMAGGTPAEPEGGDSIGHPGDRIGHPSPVVPLKPRAAAKPGTLKQRAHQLSVYLEPEVADALRDIAHAERTKLHTLILEGIDAVLRRRGGASIKQLTKRGTG